MKNDDQTVAVFEQHSNAEKAIKELAKEGFDIKHLSIVGRGYSSDEHVAGFYNVGDRIKFWGKNGAIWGGLWGWLVGGVFLTIPVVGHIIVLGFLASMVVSAIEGAVVIGGLSALAAALASIGIPKDSILNYETALKADQFLVIVRGSADEAVKAKAILEKFAPVNIDHHKADRLAA